jgi:16S rRNA processing protein RimM
MARFLEIGIIANTHGIIGELKIDCRCDSPEFVRQFDALMVGETQYSVERCRPHKNAAIVKLRGVDTVQDAQALKSKIVTADVSDIVLPEGRFFIADIIGLPVFEGSERIGTLANVLNLPASDVYVLDNGRMIPNVPAFVKKMDESGIYVELIEGL